MTNLIRKIQSYFYVRQHRGNYLRYAIGEIVLVVIGILIAVQVNTWNNHRIDRQEELELLRHLRLEFISNSAQLDSKIELRQKALQAAMQLILHTDPGKGQTQEISVDSLLAYALPVYTFDPATGIMDQLITGGKLNLISNDSLRGMLSGWNGMINDLKESEQEYSDFNRTDLRPYLYESGNYRDIINIRIKNRVIDEAFINPEFDTTPQIGYSNNPTEGSQLLASRRFENYLASLISHLSFVNNQSKGILTYMNGIIASISAELENDQ